MEREKIDKLIIPYLRKQTGIEAVSSLLDEDRPHLLDIEQDAEDRSLMGLGKVINTGVRRVLEYDLAYVALTSMEFDWGCHSTLVLKKGREVVGEEIRDKDEIDRLADRKDVWFMHRHFVVYKEKMSFPQDIMKKICHFEIPSLSVDWSLPEDGHFHSIIIANPATPSDIYLKKQYFQGRDERGLGTILVGFKQE